ncbi:MAG: porin [Cryomorphaceae bacterium]
MKLHLTAAMFCLLLTTVSQGIAQTVSYPKFGSGIRFVAADSSGTIQMSARVQNLFVASQALGEVFDPSLNAMTRRARLKFGGFAFDPRLTYKIELGLSSRDTRYRDDGPLVGNTARIVMDAVVKYEFVKGHQIWFGQTKLPGNRERVISSQKLQFVDRSLLNSRFNIDRDFGFQFRHKLNIGNAQLQLIEAVSLGEGRNYINTDVGGLEYTGRIEFLPMGTFSSKGDYYSSDLAREETPKLSIGVTGDYNVGAIRQGGQLGKIMIDSSGNYVTSDLFSLMGDMMFKYRGWSVLIETAYRESSLGDFRDASGNAYRQGFAYSGQAGYLFQNNLELAGRYTRTMRLSGMASDVKNVEQYTVGLSRYFLGHNAKVQTDLTYERSLSTTFANENLIFRLQTELSF